MRRIVLVALLWAMGLTACGAVSRFDPKFPSERKLSEAAEAYGTSLRWGQLEKAAAWVHPDWRRTFLARLTNPRRPVRFTQFDLGSIELGPERDQAVVRASFALYRPPSLREWQIMERQVWRYEPEARRWYIEPDLALYRGEVGSERP